MLCLTAVPDRLHKMSAAYGLVLIVSLAALGLSAFTALRNPPESLRRMAREALDRSVATQTSNEAFKADVSTILGAVQDERERTEKLRARARSAQQRAEAADGQQTQPQTRDELLAELRKGLM